MGEGRGGGGDQSTPGLGAGGRRFVTTARRRVGAQQVIHNRGGRLDEDGPIDLVGGNWG